MKTPENINPWAFWQGSPKDQLVFLVRNKANGKRTAGGNEEGAKPAKMSNAATINYNERKELEDPNGLEKQLQDAYVSSLDPIGFNFCV